MSATWGEHGGGRPAKVEQDTCWAQAYFEVQDTYNPTLTGTDKPTTKNKKN